MAQSVIGVGESESPHAFVENPTSPPWSLRDRPSP